MTRLARGVVLGRLLLLLALAASTGQGETQHQPPEPPAQTMEAQLSPLELLELGAPAVRYLRAFTTQCWLPDQNAPIAMFDNSWAVALVTIWNDLTVPSNGLGRLVTAMQLQAEASLMIDDKRPGDAVSVLELAVLFTLYPVHHEVDALAAWHQSLASNDTLFASRRLSLARTLSLMTRAQAAVGASSRSVDALEAAMIAGQAASELFAVSAEAAPSPPSPGLATPRREADAGRWEGIERVLEEVAHTTAKTLREAKPADLEQLLDKRGLKCRWNCGKRSSLLKILVPALRVPLRLVAVDGVEASSVEVPSDLHQQLAPSCQAHPPLENSEVDRLGAIFSQVVATLQQPLLSDIGIKCTNSAGHQQLHRCREQAAQQFERWAGGEAVAHADMASMLSHVIQVEEALWRLDQVLERAMTGVRLGDGTTWVKNKGYSWVLGSYMAAKLYPHGQGAPIYYQTRRPTEPSVGSTVCLDKTYLLDTVLRLDQEGLRGLQYALDNLHYAQFHAGGHDAWWHLLSKDNPMCSGSSCQTGEDPLATIVQTEGEGPMPAAPRPIMVDFRFMSEQQLQANLAAATDPSYRVHDPFVAAFVSVCLVSCASIYLYSNRTRLVKALTPQRGRGSGGASGASSLVAQRSAATAALRDALAGDNVSKQNVQKLHAAIEAAEAAGVEKPLIKKAKVALQALKRRKQQHPPAGGVAGTAPHRQQQQQQAQHAQQQQAQHAQQQQRGSSGGGSGGGLHPTGSGLSGSSGSGSLGRSLSDGATAALLASGSRGGWLAAPTDSYSGSGSLGDLGPGEESDATGSSSNSSRRSAACSPILTSRRGSQDIPASASAAAVAAAMAAPSAHAAAHASPSMDPQLATPYFSEPPHSPGTPAESAPRSSPADTSASSSGCTPLPSPSSFELQGAGLAGALLSAPAMPGAASVTATVTATSGGASSTIKSSQPPTAASRAAAAAAAVQAAPPSSHPTSTITTASVPSYLPEASHMPHPDPSHHHHHHPPSAPDSAASSGCTTTPTAAAAASQGELTAQPPSQQQQQLTPRQHKKLLRLQQKRAAAAAAAAAGAAAAAAASPLQSSPSPVPVAAKAAASRQQEAMAAAEEEEEKEQQQQPQLTKKQLQALAAREESAPSKQPKSAKKKAKSQQAGGNAGSDTAPPHNGGSGGGGGSRYGERSGGGGVRRTLSDSLSSHGQPGGVLSPLRHPGSANDLATQEPRMRHMTGWPSGAWQSSSSSSSGLNANAPEFSPSPLHTQAAATAAADGGRTSALPGTGAGLSGIGLGGYTMDLLSSSPGAGAGSGGDPLLGHGQGLLHSPFLGTGAAASLARAHSLSYTPDTASLAYLSPGSASSLEPQPHGGGPGGGMLSIPTPPPPPSQQQHHALLAHLQQIWGEPPGTAGEFGGGTGGSVPGSGGEQILSLAGPDPLPPFGGAPHPPPPMLSDQQQQQQLAAFLFVQQMELQQRMAESMLGGNGGGGMGGGGCESLPTSPQQLPPASADMLREVLGSPLALLPRGNSGGGGSGAGTAGGLRSADTSATNSLSPLGSDLGAAPTLLLRQFEAEAGNTAAASGSCPGGGGRELELGSPGGLGLRASLDGGAMSASPLAPAQQQQQGAPPLSSLLSPVAEVQGGLEGLEGLPARSLAAQRIDSLDLEQLGFTESGE